MAPIASRAACCAFVLALSFSSLAQTTVPPQPSASPPVTDKPQPGERTSHFKPPVIINRVEAKYPEEARRAGLTATVLLQLVVGVDGTVTDAKVAKGAGHGFDEAALEAARQLVFQPAMQDTIPVPVQFNYQVQFQLAEPEAPTLRDTATGKPTFAAKEPALYEATVEGQRPFSAASSRTVLDRDFLIRPRLTPEDILRVVPGLVLAQHQGGGKADQLFLRGFDADHGTDVSVNLDGVPVNMPSHAHGQGFADLNFLIPEVVERVDITKGPYFAEYGDFDTAGAINLVTRKSFEQSQFSVMSGLFPTLSGNRNDGTPRKFSGYRILGIASPSGTDFAPFFAAEVYGTGGPFLNSEKLQRYNLYLKATKELSASTSLSLLAMGYGSAWIGSGQIPARLVDAGVLDRYGAIDPTEGGDTQRQQAIAALTTHPDTHSTLTATLSAVHYNLSLFNDFTFQARNPVDGDEIEQDDNRTVLFAGLRYQRTDRPELGLRGLAFVTTLGGQYRSDDIIASLWKVHQRARLPSCLGRDNPCVNAAERQTDAAAFIQEDIRPFRWLRLVLGLRSDLFEFDVHSLRDNGRGGLDADHPDPIPPVAQRSIQSPKASVVVTPVEQLDLYFNFGTGFHSNDARSAVETSAAGALPRATGLEIGARARLFEGRVDLALALWQLDLASELTWNGDEGGVSPNDPTRRQGIDLEGRWQILPGLYADLDISLAKSRFKVDNGNGNAVALAPPRIITGGLTVQHPSGIRLSLRVRHIGERPASRLSASDGVPPCNPAFDAATFAGSRCYLIAEGYTVLDATLSYVQARYAVTLLVENLTNAVYREAQFGNASQVITPPPGIGPGFVPETHPVQDIHYTPGNPLGVQLATTLYF
jgi:TonB family protein